MSIDEKLEDVYYGKVKRKANKTNNINLREKTNRVLKRTPEVMTKITGYSKGAGGVKSNLEYITRNGKVELEDSRGGTYLGKESVKGFFNKWDDFEGTFENKKRPHNQRDTMKLVLSMPEGTDPNNLKKAAREFLKKEFFNHEYAFALHTDDKHPHVHVAIKTLGFDKTRLRPYRKDIQHWRESFAEKLRANGIEAEATPRVVRGVVKKSESQIIRHIEAQMKAEEGKRKPRKSKVKDAQRTQATAELKTRSDEPMKPWEKAIRKNQREAKEAWLDAAGELDKQNSPEDKVLASRIRRYVENFPKPETVNDRLKKDIKAEQEKGIER